MKFTSIFIKSGNRCGQRIKNVTASVFQFQLQRPKDDIVFIEDEFVGIRNSFRRICFC